MGWWGRGRGKLDLLGEGVESKLMGGARGIRADHTGNADL